jgi:hypothetical protein
MWFHQLYKLELHDFHSSNNKPVNIPFYDNDLLTKAAIQGGLDEDIVKSYDEKKDGVFAGFIPSLYGYDMTMGQKVFLAQFEVIKKIAAEGSAVIVGRCADYVLKDKDNVVSVFIMAPEEDCVKRAVKYYGMDEKKARDMMVKKDKQRQSYYNYYSSKKWGRADSYDLCINSSILGVEGTVKLIIQYVEDFEKRNS